MIGVPRLLIAGERSGTGKSTITIGLLMALKRRGINVQPFKSGPDFLDPMHHTMVTGRPSRNLDTWMFSSYVKQAFANGMVGADMALIEGAMGMYDGFDGRSEEGSAAHLAKTLDAPVVLVLSAKAAARSVGAIAMGFRDYDRGVKLAGVIFNNVAGPKHLQMLKDSLRGEIPCLGGVPSTEGIGLESRHLGLVPAAEVADRERYDLIRRTMEENIDIDALLSSADAAPALDLPRPLDLDVPVRARIGIAFDEAFNFYYQDNLDILRAEGAELIRFSPLRDDLPDVDGIYFGGGYPELFAEGLQSNERMRSAIRKAGDDGMPIYAECGGLMYACSEMIDLDGKTWKMSGLFEAKVSMTPKLEALGYVEARIVRDNVLGRTGEMSRGHVFHYSKVTGTSEKAFGYSLNKVKGIVDDKDGFVRNNVLASYTHLHFGSNRRFASNFVDACSSRR